MDNTDYLDITLRLANADLTTLDDLRAALHDEPWWADRVTADDLRELRGTRLRLRRALDAVVAGDAAAVMRETNGLLGAHPPRPRLSAGHEGNAELTSAEGTGATVSARLDWHVHVADVDAQPATEVAAAAAWGLAQGVVRHGLERWGRCADETCGAFFLDTSTNRRKRFCSPRCANRTHVAAFRARRQAEPGTPVEPA
ncbi:CGNR zinc finger domain-containing protein [Actinoalloteichus caeruleus]|uniref:CGNR zinc finger domain-containing protein n=1 Tax=Actinoalloteichus cyanogriseus TaxID=2893586 RepID=UPI003AAA4E5B